MYFKTAQYKKVVQDTVPETCLSADHTSKIAKNVCGHGEEDGALIKMGNKLFLQMDSNQYIIGWNLTKSVENKEIQETLEQAHRTVI